MLKKGYHKKKRKCSQDCALSFRLSESLHRSTKRPEAICIEPIRYFINEIQNSTITI